MSDRPKPNYWWSMLTMKCPRCRRGRMFTHPNPYKKIKLSYMLDMPERCPVCDQKFEMEVGFWYGTGYVSYALAFAITVASFLAWWVLVGLSLDDNRIFWWLGCNAGLLVLIQPWLMRISRVMYLYIFLRYDPEYEKHQPQKFDGA